jgi:hypothetical protein
MGHTLKAGGGVWVAYYHDGSGFVVFSTEIEALRYALANSMTVRYARFGDPDWRTRPDDPTPEVSPWTTNCREAAVDTEALGRVTR